MPKRTARALWNVVALGTIFVLAGGCASDNTTATAPSSKVAALLGSPVGLSHSEVTQGDMLTWETPAGADAADVLGYNVYMFKPAPHRPEAYVLFNRTPLARALLVTSDLRTGDTYYFKVRAVNVDGAEGEDSEVLQFVAVGHTAPSGPSRHDMIELPPVDGGGTGF
jgi:hypothetical protein